MKINFVGDIGLFKRYEDHGIDPFSAVELPKADLNIANFEFIIPNKHNKFFYDVQSHYSCNFSYLKGLFLERFDGYGLANNHSLDYGLEGAANIIALIQSRGCKVFGFSGDLKYSVGSFENSGIKIVIIAFVKEGRWSKIKHGFGPDQYDVDKICTLISECKELYNHVIIYPHWGTELVEIPDPQDTKNARKFIDSGATAVVGHHPHISQGIETYKQGIIAYSLGSFIYIPEEELGYSNRDVNREVSICLQLELQKDHIISYTPYYYRYNSLSLIPEPAKDSNIYAYAAFLGANIHNEKLYGKQIREKLLKRELRSLWTRIRINPVQTCINYLQFLKPSKLKKFLQ